jgi:trimeric autotransporter adhesin
LVDFQKEVKQTSKSIADDLAAKMFDKGGSILDWWRNLLKRMAIEIASTQFIMPIVQQVVGAVPQLFGIQAPANASGGQTAAGGGLTGTLTNTALSKGLGWAVDKAVPGGLMGGLDAWGYSTLGVGTASYGAPLVGANGMLTGGGATSLATPTGITGGLSGYFGAASAGAFGGVLGGLIGTAANSKAIGGLSGAALGAGSAALASYLGLGALGGPVGLAVAAIAGGVMGLLGTAKKSVGPNGASNIRLDSGAVQAGDSATDNGASSEKDRRRRQVERGLQRPGRAD